MGQWVLKRGGGLVAFLIHLELRKRGLLQGLILLLEVHNHEGNATSTERGLHTWQWVPQVTTGRPMAFEGRVWFRRSA